MGLFSLFKKDPDKIYYALAYNIVESAKIYKEQVNAPSYSASSNAGAELIYLLMHILDRESFAILGAAKRDNVFDEVLQRVVDINGLVDSDSLLSNLDARQELYGQIDTVFSDGFPSKGSVIFAFCFYAHKACQKTFRKDLDEVLLGRQDVDDSNVNDFPDIEETINISIFVSTVISELDIPKHLKDL